MNDLRLAFRTLSRSSWFALAASGLLAAGIGVTIVLFSALDAVVLRPLPVNHPEQIVRFVQRLPKVGVDSRIPLPVYEALRDRSSTLSAVFGEHEENLVMTEPAPAEYLRIHLATPNFFEALGVRAFVGRTLTTGDAADRPGDPPAVLSYSFWQRRFNGNPSAINQTIRIAGHDFVIVGVLPRDFNGLSADTAPDVRLPLRVWPLLDPGWQSHPGLVQLDLAGRLRPRTSLSRGQAESRTIWAAALNALPKGEGLPFGAGDFRYPLELDPLERGTSILRDRYASALKFLIACSTFLLLMICSNVAGLLLARGASRRADVAVRLALGATQIQIARQVLAECSLLAGLAAIGGIALAALLNPILSALLPPIHDLSAHRLTLALAIGIDRRVLLFAVGLSTATVLLFGLAPAISASRVSLDSILRGVRASSAMRGRQVLIFIQVGLCTFLLSGAALLIRTFKQLHEVNPGFDPRHVVTFTIDPPTLFKPGQSEESLLRETTAFFNGLIQQVGRTPGVDSVALSVTGVLRDHGMATTVAPAGEQPATDDLLAVGMQLVSPEYFETMGIRLLQGRSLRSADIEQERGPEKVMVNQAFVEHYFHGMDPIGRRFGRANPGQVAAPESEIVGVVNDTKYRSLREVMPPIIYSLFEGVEGTIVVHVRTRGNPTSMIGPIRDAIHSFSSAMPILEVETLSEEVSASAAGERLTAAIASAFGCIAVLLVAAGIYAMLAFAVVQRRREIGIRIALGATSNEIRRLVGRQGLVLVLGGVTVGFCAARAAAVLIRSLLYGIDTGDIPSLAAAAAITSLIAFAAALIPAIRAARIDAAAAIRET